MKGILEHIPDIHSSSESEPLLDIEQAARFLNVSETSLRRWTNDGRLSCLRVGRRRERRFRKSDLLAFMENEPAGRTRPGEGAGAHGMHVCGLYAADEGQVQQAVSFLLEGLAPGTVSFVVGGADMRGRILAGLERAHPALEEAVADGRLIISDYAGTADAQLGWWEARIEESLRRGATQVRVIGDAGAFAAAASSEELLQYEADYDRRITARYPVATMCQYDVRLFSGRVVMDALRSHPQSFGQPAERILA